MAPHIVTIGVMSLTRRSVVMADRREVTMLKTAHETRLRPVCDLSRGAAVLIGREESTQPVGRPRAASPRGGFSHGRWIVWVSAGETLGFAFPAAVGVLTAALGWAKVSPIQYWW